MADRSPHFGHLAMPLFLDDPLRTFQLMSAFDPIADIPDITRLAR